MGAGDRQLSVLPRRFYDRPVVEVARDLLGCVVRRTSPEGVVAVRLSEVEAYAGRVDPGSHAFRGETPRNAVMFGPPGHVYVYFTYGMHWCMNLVCGPPGEASAVLLRAGEVVDGLELARARRPGAPDRDLARGPARLTTALGVDKSLNGTDAVRGTELRVHRGRPLAAEIAAGPRTGVAAGGETPWRFHLAGDPTVSSYRAHVPRRRRKST